MELDSRIFTGGDAKTHAAAIRKTRTFAKTSSGHPDEVTLYYAPLGRFVIMIPLKYSHAFIGGV